MWYIIRHSMPENQVYSGEVVEKVYNDQLKYWNIYVASGGFILLARTPDACVLNEGSEVKFTAEARRMGVRKDVNAMVSFLNSPDCRSCSLALCGCGARKSGLE